MKENLSAALLGNQYSEAQILSSSRQLLGAIISLQPKIDNNRKLLAPKIYDHKVLSVNEKDIPVRSHDVPI